MGSWKSVYTGSNLSLATQWGRAVSKLFTVPLYSVQSEDVSVLGAAKLAAEQQGWKIKGEFTDVVAQELESSEKPLAARFLARVDETVAALNDCP